MTSNSNTILISPGEAGSSCNIPPAPSSSGDGGSSGGDGKDSADWKLGFPWKLHKVLQDAEDEGFDDIISWTPNGKAFVVFDKDRFAEEIMPRYFRSNKFKTFQRSSNMWGFQTAVRHYPYQGLERGDCHHELFLKGRLDLCHGMARIKSLKEEAEIQRRNMERAKKDEANHAKNDSGQAVGMSSSTFPSGISFVGGTSAATAPTEQHNAVQALTAALLNNPAVSQNLQSAANTNPMLTLLPGLLQQVQQQQQQQQQQRAMAMNASADANGGNGSNHQGLQTVASLLATLQTQQQAGCVSGYQSSANGAQFSAGQQQQQQTSTNDIFLQQVLQSLQGRNDASKNSGTVAPVLQLLLSMQQNQNSTTVNPQQQQQQQLIQALHPQLNVASSTGGDSAQPPPLMQYMSNGQQQAGPAMVLQALQQAHTAQNQANSAGNSTSTMELLRRALQVRPQVAPPPASSRPDMNTISQVLQAQAMINASKGGAGNASMEDIARFLAAGNAQASSSVRGQTQMGEGKEVSDVSDLSSDDSQYKPDVLARVLDSKNNAVAADPKKAASAAAIKTESSRSDTTNSSSQTSNNNGGNALEAARGLQRLLESDQAKSLLSSLWNR